MKRLALIALLTTACQGPLAPIDVGSKEVHLDLLLGEKVKSVASAPLPPIELPIGPTGFPVRRAQAAAPEAAPAETPSGPCPEADPLAVAKLVAMNKVDSPPKPATYAYRTTGRFRVGGANAADTLLPGEASWVISNIVTDPAGFTFDAAVTLGTATTTTTYRILQTGAAAPVPGAREGYATVRPYAGIAAPPPDYPGQPVDDNAQPMKGVPPGLYIAKVTSTGGIPFQPPPPGLAVSAFPLDEGTIFDAAASDGKTTISHRSTIKRKQTVDACGTPLDAYTVEISNGRIEDAATQEVLTFTSSYALGTQFGGLPLFISTAVSGQQGTTPVTREVQMTINREPEKP